MSKLIWITGLSGSGKTTIGEALFLELKRINENTVFLDGDNFREILGNDLKYSTRDRIINAKRIHRMCKFLVSQNINVICSTMSLYKEVLELNRDKIENYFEIFIECNLDELLKRDKKGIYSDAIKGKKNDVVGINLPFFKPKNCDLFIDNSKKKDLKKKVKLILNLIENKKIINNN